MPAWCTPTPHESKRFKILPKAVVKRVPLAASFDGLALLLACDAEVRQRARGGQGGILREMDDVKRGLAAAQRELDGALERRVDVFVGQGHRARRIGDDIDFGARAIAQGLRDLRDVAEGGAHEHELRVRQREQGDLPGPAAIGVGKVMELVHRHAAHVGVLALSQRLVGEDLGGAADDGGGRVDMRVAGDHAHVVAAEHLDQVEELLGDEGLDGRGVVGPLALGDGHVQHAERDERLARAGRRAQDHVVARGEVHEGLLLVRPQLDALVGSPLEEALEGLVGREPRLGRAAVLGLPPAGGERAERACRQGPGPCGERARARGCDVGAVCHVLPFSR